MKSRLLYFLSAAGGLAPMACAVPVGTAQDSAKPPVPSGNITISLWGIATQPWQIMIDDFQKTYPNLKVKWTKYSTDEIKQAVRVVTAAGQLCAGRFTCGASLRSP